MANSNQERAFNKAQACETNGHDFFSHLREKSQHLEHEFKRYSEDTEQYIKKNPVKSTIFAGIAGLLLGKLLSK